jgi:hypothetical protein
VTNVATPEKRSRSAFYQGWGGWAYRIPGSARSDGTLMYKPGAIVVDIFDARTKRLLWTGSARGLSSKDANSEKHRVAKAITAMLETFPADTDSFLPARGEAKPPDSALNPQLFFASSPAVLVRIDGEPKYQQIAGTELRRLVNTDSFIVADQADINYLRLGNIWMESDGLSGDWSPAGTLPVGIERALNGTPGRREGDLVLTIPSDDQIPAVFTATTPAYLIVTDGPPRFTSIKGSSLLRVANTSATVVKEPTDKQLYVRLPDGWVRSWTTNGPWERIGDAALPTDIIQMLSSQSAMK